MDSLAPARSALRAVRFAEFRPLVPNQLKSASFCNSGLNSFPAKA